VIGALGKSRLVHPNSAASRHAVHDIVVAPRHRSAVSLSIVKRKCHASPIAAIVNQFCRIEQTAAILPSKPDCNDDKADMCVDSKCEAVLHGSRLAISIPARDVDNSQFGAHHAR
jgi:hypothetical protein